MPYTITGELFRHLLGTHQMIADQIRQNKDNSMDEWKADRIALLVELGEFANEGQWFKYWKKHRTPITERLTPGTYQNETGWHQHTCNPLIDEYADVFTFILSIGNQMDIEWVPEIMMAIEPPEDMLDLLDQAYKLFRRIEDPRSLIIAFEFWLGVGERVGFTMDQIIAAFMDNCQENKRRQDSGY